MPSKAALRAIEEIAIEELEYRFRECKKIATQKVSDSRTKFTLFQNINSTLDATPTFTIDELEVGKVVQRGKCSVTREIRGLYCKEGVSTLDFSDNPMPSEDGEDNNIGTDVGRTAHSDKVQMAQDKQFISTHCIREGGGGARYVVKTLSPEKAKDPKTYTQGLVDMAIETMILSSISHPHIITLRAIGSKEDMLNPNFFFVIDRLTDTLDTRILKWKATTKSANNRMNKLLRKDTSRQKLNELMETKLSYAYDLMGAIEYLHNTTNIVFRNLKPENVGFNIRDDIVLFGFGLAREVHEKDRVSEHTWKLTGETGTLRYMAPEVAQNKPYGYSADIYSFAVLLWQMLMMEKPYDSVSSTHGYLEMVAKVGARPKIDEESWGPSLTGFIKSCWHQDLTKRPSASHASAVLKREAAKAIGGSDLELNNFRRKSTFVNRDSLIEKRKSSIAAHR